MECLAAAGMAAIEFEKAGIADWILHVSARTKFVLEWAKVVLPSLNASRIVTGHVRVSHPLLVPEIGCGGGSLWQQQWLRQRVRSWVDTNAAHDQNEGILSDTKDGVVVITRTKSRSMVGWNEIARAATRWLLPDTPPSPWVEGWGRHQEALELAHGSPRVGRPRSHHGSGCTEGQRQRAIENDRERDDEAR